jgi:hypothetical protein
MMPDDGALLVVEDEPFPARLPIRTRIGRHRRLSPATAPQPARDAGRMAARKV